MTTYTQQLNLDVSTTGRYKYVYAKQGDRASRFVNVTMFRDGEKIMPESGLSAKIRAVKPDGTSIYNPATINEDGSITAELTAQTLAVNGDVFADIVLVGNNEEVLSSVSFIIRVEEAPLGTVEPSSSEFLELMELLLATEEASREAGASATAAASSKADAEAYAIGKRNGQDVPSTDPAYHNNAKYYAEQAETAQNPVKYVEQTLSDSQKAQARQNINAAAPDGYYGESGGVYQYSTNFLGKNTPQNAHDITFRPTASQFSGQSWGMGSVDGQAATIERIKGKTLVWNQMLRQDATFKSTSSAVGWHNNRGSGSIADNTITVADARSSTTATYGVYYKADDRIETGHKYYVGIKNFSINAAQNFTRFYFAFTTASNVNDGYYYLYDSSYEGDIEYIAAITKEVVIATSFCFFYQDAGGVTEPTESTFSFDKRINIVDLTRMFGAGNEPNTVEEFRAMFPLDYYEYNAGELLSFNGTGLKTVGFNQLDADGHIHVLAGLTYKIEGTYTSLVDSEGNAVTVTNGEFIPTKADTYTMTGGSCVHLKWSGVRDGETEEYWSNTLALPVAQYFPDGMRSAGAVYDELTKDKAVQRIGSRAYQSGDEDDGTVVTDGTTTHYPLAEPVETPISPALNLTYRVDDFGTEMLLPVNDDEPVTAPMDADIVYQIDYEAQVRNNDSLNISKASMDNFIAAFNASGIGTITQTWDAANKKYTYTVTALQPEEA